MIGKNLLIFVFFLFEYSNVYLVGICKLTKDTQPVDLYLNFEKSSLKNQVQVTGFLVYFELDFCRLQMAVKMKFEIDFDFSNLIFQKSCTDQQGDILVVSGGKHFALFLLCVGSPWLLTYLFLVKKCQFVAKMWENE